MAFVAEDGTGLANANSYGSVASYAAYWLELNIDLSQYLLEDKQASLVAATQHIDLFFGCRLFGYKATSTQALEFPRLCLYDQLGVAITGVPTKVKYATFEYAYRELSTGKALAPDPVVDTTGLQMQATFKKVGPLEKRTTFLSNEPKLLPSYPKADAFLKEFAWGGGGSHRA